MMITKRLVGWTLPRWFWPVLLGLNFLLHAPFFRLPPTGVHVWRQCNTMALARNFYEEGMNILTPRVDRRGDTNGITGSQFPSYEWLVAGSYHVFGFHEVLPRLINWLISLAGIMAFYYLGRQISGSDLVGAIGAWSLSWSPEVFFHSVNAMPDILALTASIAGLLWFGCWRETRRTSFLLLSMLAVTLAGLTKLQYLAVGFPIAVFVVRDGKQRRFSSGHLVQLAGYALVTVAVPLAWYAYARELIRTSGLGDYGLELRPATSLAAGLLTIRQNLLVDMPSVLLGFGTLGFILVGLWRLARGLGRPAGPVWAHIWLWPGLAWGAGLAAYYLIELEQMRGHIYYLLPLLPPLLLLAAGGAAYLRRLRWARLLLLGLLLFQPVWAFARGGWGRWLHNEQGVLPELLNPETRAQLEAATPPGALCLVGPDVSGCKDFYFLHKKGFGFAADSELLTRMPSSRLYFADCVARGARYLYTNHTDFVQNPVLRPYLGRQVAQVGGFGVWELRPAPAPDSVILTRKTGF